MKQKNITYLMALGLFAGIASDSTYAKDEFDLVDEDLYNRAGGERFGQLQTKILFDEQVPADAHINGMWTMSIDWPLYAIHAAVLPNKKIITYGTGDNGNGRAFNYDIWNPASGEHNTLDVQTATNIFCSAQNMLVNGKLLITGGDEVPDGPGGSGLRETNLYDPEKNIMSSGSQMYEDRWYPSLTTMPDGRILVHGGRISKEQAAITPEIYNPDNDTFKQLIGARSETVYNIADKGWYYPRTFINSSGKAVFFKGNDDSIYEINVNAGQGKGSLTKKSTTTGGDFRFYYPTVQLEPGKVLAFKANRKTQIINTNNYSVENIDSIPHERIWADATLLADGKVIVTGGSSERQNEATAITAVDIFNPKTKKWSTGASALNSRLYHSSTVLMSNGAVLIAGGGPPGEIKHKNAEVYYPPYLFNKNGFWANRPVITEGPDYISYKKRVIIKYNHDRKISRVTMVKLGSTTHSYDMGQLFKEVAFKQGRNKVILSATSRRKQEITPGYYMIFLIDDLGVPSEAHIVRLAS